jgi:ATP-dependent Lhr-like helicase
VQALDAFSPATRRWFEDGFATPTRVQAGAWPLLAAGRHTLLVAPTGSGKTLAAFLAALDRLSRLPDDAARGVRVLYVSPLKALVHDIERNLRAPLVGLARTAERLGEPFRPITVDVRTGDTPQKERQRQARRPGDVLVTTPESLYLILTSGARDALRTVETVIVDEIHVLAGTKRGVHLALSLERLAALTARDPQRVGLSATQRPLSAAARFLGGDRPVEIVDAAEPPRLALQLVVPVPDMENPPVAHPAAPAVRAFGQGPPTKRLPAGAMGSTSPLQYGLWPSIHPRLLALIEAHRSTIVFVNSRVLCERLTQALNELAGRELVRAHHGSLSHDRRAAIEEALKAGDVPALVATSSLELGIDMGAVDLVVLVESPGSAARGLQRVGRAGHGVGETSLGRIFPKFRGDLLEATVVAGHMLEGRIEATRTPERCLDVLAQQVVAIVSEAPIAVDDLLRLVRRAAPYADLSRDALVAVLDMLSGRYPSDAFADLTPSLVWDRAADVLSARRGARLRAVLDGGTIPDRGLYRVVLGPGGPRLGELDEEMVFESRVGDTIVLGASSWRIVEITRDEVVVAPAPGAPGRLPFWHGEKPARPLELGRALGAFVRQVGELPADEVEGWLTAHTPLDALAARNLVAYLDDQRQATGTLPTDRAITVERFRDELGDWRVCVLTPFGGKVHAPWALAIEAALSTSAGFEVQALWSDDGVALRFADVEELPPVAALLPDPDEVEDLVVDQLRRSPLFAARFRENAGRSLLLPRRRGRSRTPLWMQRRRSAELLAVAERHPGFPIVLETYRECLQDVFDLPALTEVLGAIRDRRIRVDEVETRSASPFARSLAFQYVAAYLYDDDQPSAERRAAALSLDRTLLRELLGQETLRDLLDPAAVAEVEAELQHTAPGRRARHADALHDLLRRLGDLGADELTARCEGDPAAWVAELVNQRRVVPVRIAGAARWIAAEDAGRYREALGVVLPSGLPAVFLEPGDEPLEALIRRYARTRGPFPAADLAARYGLLPSAVEAVLRGLEARELLHHGELRPDGVGREWCDPDVLRRLRRATLARLRHQIAPVDADVHARFLLAWHGVGGRPRSGLPALREAVERLEGVAIPFSALEREILPARVADYQPALLDQLGAMGEVVWVGRGPLGPDDGRVALYRRDRVPLLVDPTTTAPQGDLAARLLDHLRTRGASFLVELQTATDAPLEELEHALWDLVWAGHVTNDTFQPLRALGTPKARDRDRRVRLAGGRWSLVERLIGTPPADTERALARTTLLLERHGVLARDAVLAEEVPGGFAALYPVLRALEEGGRARRGWFVDGLEGVQFAVPGAVDRLRACRDAPPDVQIVSAVDPALAWGAVLPWPDTVAADARPRRVAGARVVLVGGRPVLLVGKGDHALVLFREALGDEGQLDAAVAALKARQGWRTLRIEKVDGAPALTHAAVERLLAAGFTRDHRALLLARS